MKIKLTTKQIMESVNALAVVSQKPLGGDISYELGMVALELKPIAETTTDTLQKRFRELDAGNSKEGRVKYDKENIAIAKKQKEIEFKPITFADLTADKDIKFEPLIFSALHWLITKEDQAEAKTPLELAGAAPK